MAGGNDDKKTDSAVSLEKSAVKEPKPKKKVRKKRKPKTKSVTTSDGKTKKVRKKKVRKRKPKKKTTTEQAAAEVTETNEQAQAKEQAEQEAREQAAREAKAQAEQEALEQAAREAKAHAEQEALEQDSTEKTSHLTPAVGDQGCTTAELEAAEVDTKQPMGTQAAKTVPLQESKNTLSEQEVLDCTDSTVLLVGSSQSGKSSFFRNFHGNGATKICTLDAKSPRSCRLVRWDALDANVQVWDMAEHSVCDAVHKSACLVYIYDVSSSSTFSALKDRIHCNIEQTIGQKQASKPKVVLVGTHADCEREIALRDVLEFRQLLQETYGFVPWFEIDTKQPIPPNVQHTVMYIASKASDPEPEPQPEPKSDTPSVRGFQPISTSSWVPDSHVTACMDCKEEFWFFRRRHHCRFCGHIFCYECSPYDASDQRRCNECDGKQYRESQLVEQQELLSSLIKGLVSVKNQRDIGVDIARTARRS